MMVVVMVMGGGMASWGAGKAAVFLWKTFLVICA